jgi:hypothetical protein
MARRPPQNTHVSGDSVRLPVSFRRLTTVNWPTRDGVKILHVYILEQIGESTDQGVGAASKTDGTFGSEIRVLGSPPI